MNVLAIGAHFDDIELGCGGSLIKHVRAGDNVTMLVVSNSAYKDENDEWIRTPEIAREEGHKAAEFIGAELVCLDYDTFDIQFAEPLTKELNHFMSKHNTDMLYSHWIKDVHRDHQNAGKVALMAGRHVPRVLMYRSNYYDSGESFQGTFYSDVSEVIDDKLTAIRMHDSELSRVNYAWIDFIKHQNANDGLRSGVQYAEVFEAVRFLY